MSTMTHADPRIPVRFGSLADRSAQEAVLTDGAAQAPEPAARLSGASPFHGNGCACCGPRSPAALALSGLFRGMATGRHPPFTRVLVAVSPAAEAAVRAALADDVLVQSRFRLA